MVKGYTFIEEWSFTDAAFDAWGGSLGELFEVSGRATFEVMAEVERIALRIERCVSLRSDSPRELLYDWLSELIFLKDTEGLIFSVFHVKLDMCEGEGGGYTLEGKALGEEVSTFEGELGSDVKAVTMHLFEVEETPDGWRARVLLDI